MTLQLRTPALQSVPPVYFFRQKDKGMECWDAGQLQPAAGGFRCRTEGRMEQVLKGQQITDLDGVIVYNGPEEYYATTWKNIRIFPGTLRIGKGEEEAPEETGRDIRQETVFSEEDGEAKEDITEAREIKEQELPDRKERQAAAEEQQPEDIGERIGDTGNNNAGTEGSGKEPAPELQAQSVCASCPARTGDYGKRILSMFPVMYPFVSGFGRCVRMEPKDIGCLPISAWSLAGNHFLLHGYYCYRHLIFIERSKGHYCVGVPGIYSDKEEKQAGIFGFREFVPLSQQEQQQGAFGYWLYPLEGNNRE